MVKLVTDSVSDLPPEVVKELEITVIPLNVQFGLETSKATPISYLKEIVMSFTIIEF
jgi:fatty acid-binding protein DegV